MLLRIFAVTILFASAALAQSPAPNPSGNQSPELRAELKKLAAAAQSLHDDLPSFTCQETAKSQLLKKKKVKEQTQFVADVRVQRVADSRLFEQLRVKQVNGKAFNGGYVKMPIEVEGGFGEALFFFLPSTQPCLVFTLTPGRIDFESKPGTLDRSECDLAGTRHGFALLDAEGNVTHIEREVPPEFTEKFHLADYSSIDLVSTELGGRSYPLSARMSADVREDDEVKHFEATYTDCHLYKATVTILPGTEPVTGPAPSEPEAAPHR